MNYAVIKNCDIANGPGVRVSLFVSGCRRHCKNCFNKEAWDFSYGKSYTDEVLEKIIADLKPSYISGFSLLGGEPFEPENQPDVLKTVKEIKKRLPEKSIWVYTGFLYDNQLLKGEVGDPSIVNEILENIDVLVDGPFIEEQKRLDLIFRGSANQRIIDVPKSLKAGSVILLDGVWERKMGSVNIYE
ncbi:MAG: anaerobic ribonucleoside-triphosphate reductase activating protein [Acutalibacteraceae bacterium]